MSNDNAGQINKGRRKFLTASTAVVGGIGLAATCVPFATAWTPSERTEAAGAPVEVDLSDLQPGQQKTIEWRGKPIWIVRRTQEALAELSKNDNDLRDPSSEVDQQPAYAKNAYRSLRKEYLVLIGICTHLGCVPKYRPNEGEVSPDWHGGFFCPCHGSKFDLAGRVYKGVPAPINLEVPPYKFINDHTILVGVNPDAEGKT